MKKSLALTAGALLLLLAPMANAHQALLYTAEVPAVHPVTHEGRTLYVMRGSVWEETNGKLDEGVQSHSGQKGDTGVQKHAVCYGTFTPQDVVAWNWVASHEHFGHPEGAAEQQAGDFSNNDVNYIPFEAGSGFYAASTSFDAAGCAGLGGEFVEADTYIAGI